MTRVPCILYFFKEYHPYETNTGICHLNGLGNNLANKGEINISKGNRIWIQWSQGQVESLEEKFWQHCLKFSCICYLVTRWFLWVISSERIKREDLRIVWGVTRMWGSGGCSILDVRRGSWGNGKRVISTSYGKKTKTFWVSAAWAKETLESFSGPEKGMWELRGQRPMCNFLTCRKTAVSALKIINPECWEIGILEVVVFSLF